jgi:hypothetical protein
MMVQLIYTSRLIFDASNPHGWSRIQDIVIKARQRNNIAGITGFLIVGTDWVAQILEGDINVVNRTFQRILADVRHRDVRLIDIRMTTQRHFSGWSLGNSTRPHIEIPFEALTPEGGSFTPLAFDVILGMAQVEAA